MESLLFFGASGQVGGAFVTAFRREFPDIPITFFLRSTELDSALESLDNCTVVHGTFEDERQIEELVSTHSIILNCAASINVPFTEAILRGVRERKALTSKTSVVYHLSGAGNFVDNSKTGAYIATKHRFNDVDTADVRTISAANLPNGPVDEMLFTAALTSEAKVYFVCPAGIYGHSKHHIGRKVGALSAYAPGVWVNSMLQNTQALGFGPYVGDGTSVFGTIHVNDVVSLMTLVFQRVLDTVDSYQPEDVYRNWYNGVSTEEPSKKLAAAFAGVQARRRNIPSPVIKSVAYEDAGSVARYIAGNMLIDCDNSRSLGWQPQGPDIYTELGRL